MACAGAITSRAVVITGCSGGGKSTLLAELADRGWATVPEPGRRIVTQEMAAGGRALPWIDLRAFADRAYAMATDDLARVSSGRWTIFDRGLIDAAAAREFAGGPAAIADLSLQDRYFPLVFFAPPWPQLFRADAERRHDWDDAVAESDRLMRLYTDLGHRLVELPRLPVADRADFMAVTLAGRPTP